MKCRKGVMKFLLVAVLSLAMAVPASAATKEEVQSQIASLKSQQAELESQLASLKKNKTDTESYIAELDSKIQVYLKQLEEVTAQIQQTDAEITLTKEQLEQAEADKEVQYAALKARIKAIYESGEDSALTLLLGESDLKSFLNDAEYMKKVNEYDHNLLVKLQETEDKIAAYEKELEEKQELQEAQKEQCELDKEALEKIVAQKEEELVAIGADISSVNSSISSNQQELDENNALLAQIEEEERRAAEEAARRAAEEAARQKAAEEEARKAEEARQAEESRQAEAATEAAAEAEEEDDDDYDSSSDSSSSSYYEDTSSYEEETSYSSSGFIWPVGAYNITSGFGYRDAPTAGATSYHCGIDIGASSGQSIWAAASGTVETASYSSAMGNYVVISHGNGVCTIYEHCSSLAVSAGQSVSQGQVIAYVGSTGISTGSHLHFGVTVGGSYVNPLSYVSP